MSGLFGGLASLVDAETGLQYGESLEWETSLASQAAATGLRLDFSIAADSEWFLFFPATVVGNALVVNPNLDFSLSANSENFMLFPAIPAGSNVFDLNFVYNNNSEYLIFTGLI